jgi:hypothetical protein
MGLVLQKYTLEVFISLQGNRYQVKLKHIIKAWKGAKHFSKWTTADYTKVRLFHGGERIFRLVTGKNLLQKEVLCLSVRVKEVTKPCHALHCKTFCAKL